MLTRGWACRSCRSPLPEAEPVEAVGIEERQKPPNYFYPDWIQDLFNKVGNFQHCRSKLHYVKLGPVVPVVPEAEPVEAVGTENVNNLPNSRRLSLSKS